MSESVPQRIGDAERDRAAEYLREHLAQGRLTQDEFDERIGAALSARTAADLDPLFVDLPAPRPDGQLAPSPQPAAWPAYAPPPAAIEPRPAEAPAPSAAGASFWQIAATVAWPAWLLLMFATGWSYVWLVFIPIIVSSVAGKMHSDRRQLRSGGDRPRELG